MQAFSIYLNLKHAYNAFQNIQGKKCKYKPYVNLIYVLLVLLKGLSESLEVRGWGYESFNFVYYLFCEHPILRTI